MTLSALATLICTKLLKTDAASIAAAKEFLRARHTLIWESFLWKDSVVTWYNIAVPIDPNTLDYHPEVVLPDAAARPVLVWDATNQNVLTPGTMLDMARCGDATATADGTLMSFTELPATGLPVPFFSGGYDLRFICQTEDIGSVIGIQYGGDFDTTRYTGSDILTSTDRTQRIVLSASLEWNEILAKVARMTKPVTAGSVSVQIRKTGSPIVTWSWPAESTSSEFAAIRLIDRPTITRYGTGMEIGVLAKRKPRSFVNDEDSPALRGCDSVLLAMATGDMLERERMYAKAQAKFQEGSSLLEVMKDQERNQSAFSQKIVPEAYTGAGDRDQFGW